VTKPLPGSDPRSLIPKLLELVEPQFDSSGGFMLSNIMDLLEPTRVGFVQKVLVDNCWSGNATDSWRYPSEYLAADYEATVEPDDATQLAFSIASFIHHPEPFVRANVIEFFRLCLRAPDAGLLLQTFRQRPELFDGIDDPLNSWSGGLRASLATALAWRMAKGDESLRETVRAEALEPGRADPVLPGLVDADLKWLEKRIGQIISGSPDALPRLLRLYALNKLDLRRTLEGLVEVLPKATVREELKNAFKRGPERVHYLNMI